MFSSGSHSATAASCPKRRDKTHKPSGFVEQRRSRKTGKGLGQFDGTVAHLEALAGEHIDAAGAFAEFICIEPRVGPDLAAQWQLAWLAQQLCEQPRADHDQRAAIVPARERNDMLGLIATGSER